MWHLTLWHWYGIWSSEKAVYPIGPAAPKAGYISGKDMTFWKNIYEAESS